MVFFSRISLPSVPSILKEFLEEDQDRLEQGVIRTATVQYPHLEPPGDQNRQLVAQSDTSLK